MTSDVPWMITPLPFLGIEQEITGTSYLVSSKNKDGDGSKRKNKKNGASPGGTESKSNVFLADVRTHFSAVERLIEDESVLLHHILSLVPKVPGLVNKSMIKEGKDGTPRLNGTMRKKMGEYYHDILWRTSGHLIEEPLLWDGARDRIPMGLAHPKLPLVIATLLKDYVSAQLGDSYPSLVLPSIHIVIELLNLHAISASWDVQVCYHLPPINIRLVKYLSLIHFGLMLSWFGLVEWNFSMQVHFITFWLNLENDSFVFCKLNRNKCISTKTSLIISLFMINSLPKLIKPQIVPWNCTRCNSGNQCYLRPIMI